MSRIRMMMVAGTTALLTAGVAWAQFPFPGYLGDRVMDTSTIVPTAPRPDSPRAGTDRAIFTATRALEGSPRWDMAIGDLDERRVVYAMRCAIGVEIKEQGDAPKLTRVLLRVAPDLTKAVDTPKASTTASDPTLSRKARSAPRAATSWPTARTIRRATPAGAGRWA